MKQRKGKVKGKEDDQDKSKAKVETPADSPCEAKEPAAGGEDKGGAKALPKSIVYTRHERSDGDNERNKRNIGMCVVRVKNSNEERKSGWNVRQKIDMRNTSWWKKH